MLYRWSRAAKRWTTLLLVAAGFLGATGSAQAVLQARDLNGDTFTDAYYDTALDITWLKDANAAGVKMNWSSANSWADGLVVAGYNDWRLARINGTINGTETITRAYDCSGGTAAACAASGNELGYMYNFNMRVSPIRIDRIDKTGTYDFLGLDLGGGDTLDNILPVYWSGTGSDFSAAWDFGFSGGGQRIDVKNFELGAWAVRPGDVIAAVPEPETYAMLLTGLGLLGWRARRR